MIKKQKVGEGLFEVTLDKDRPGVDEPLNATQNCSDMQGKEMLHRIWQTKSHGHPIFLSFSSNSMQKETKLADILQRVSLDLKTSRPSLTETSDSDSHGQFPAHDFQGS